LAAGSAQLSAGHSIGAVENLASAACTSACASQATAIAPPGADIALAPLAMIHRSRLGVENFPFARERSLSIEPPWIGEVGRGSATPVAEGILDHATLRRSLALARALLSSNV